MKISKLCDLLAVLADLIDDKSARATLLSIIVPLRPFGLRDSGDLVATGGEGINESVGSTPIRCLEVELAAFQPLFVLAASSQAKQGLKHFLSVLNKHSHMNADEFARTVSEKLVPNAPSARDGQSLNSAYIEALQTTLHDDERFREVYGALASDPRVGKDGLVEIASKFAYQMAKGTSKKVALERIWKVHDASQAYADRSRSMRGRSAG